MGLFDKVLSVCAEVNKAQSLNSKISKETPSKIETSTESDETSSTPETAQQDRSCQDSSSKSSEPNLRPLRLGSFNFDNNDGYTYKSLFDEADDMVKLSNLMYTLAALRELARSGKLNEEKSSQILKLPLPINTAMAILATEADSLKEALSDGEHDSTLSALQSLVDRNIAPKKETDTAASPDGIASIFGGWMSGWNVGAESASKQAEPGVATIIAVGDLKSYEELVYAVGINPAQKRITVGFRGSVTKTDFLTDANMALFKLPGQQQFSESLSDDDSENTICVHQGFYEYLFGDGKGKKNKYEEIMAYVRDLFDAESSRRKEYKLFVTGHSLGGALATLFGFYASVSGFPLPVTVISVASPRVGNLAFARTFTELESQGKIRHLRIANHKDPVTLGPQVSSRRAFTLATMAFSPLGYLAMKATGMEAGAEETYYHTGIKLKLRVESKCELSYSGASFLTKHPESQNSRIEEKAEAEEIKKETGEKSSWTNSFNIDAQNVPMASYHFGTVYTERLASVESSLAGLMLNDVYQEKIRGL